MARSKKEEEKETEAGAPAVKAWREFTSPRNADTLWPDTGPRHDMPSFIFRRQLTIEWGQCDPAGIVFNSRFFEMFDTSTWGLFDAALGVKPHELSDVFGIMGIPLVDARANFLRAIKFGDVVDMTSRITEFRRSSFDVEHRLSVGSELAVEGGETRVWAVRSKDDPEKISGAAIPADVIAKFDSASSS